MFKLFQCIVSYVVYKFDLHIMFWAENYTLFILSFFSLSFILSWISVGCWLLNVSGFCLCEEFNLLHEILTCVGFVNPILLCNAGCHNWTAPSNFPFSSEGWISWCTPQYYQQAWSSESGLLKIRDLKRCADHFFLLLFTFSHFYDSYDALHAFNTLDLRL